MMTDRKTPLLIMGIVCVVVGLFLILAGIESWYSYFYDYTTYRLNALGYLGIVIFIIGIILLVLAFLIKDETTKELQCPVCGARVLPGYKICPNCRAYFKKQCANCKAELDSIVTYCPHCGSTTFIMPDGTLQQPQAPPPPSQPQQAPPPTAPGIRSCISCGGELGPESKYCPWCGTVVR
jgi:DNA-directed RNA polymerase subunit RPC12/RpoP